MADTTTTTKNQRVQDLQTAAKQYLDAERTRLNAEYDFLSNILKARGYSALENHNTDQASALLVSSISQFLAN